MSVMAYQGDLIETLMRMGGDKLELKRKLGFCEYESGESSYGAGDSMLCGRDAVGSSIQDETPRCRLHLNVE